MPQLRRKHFPVFGHNEKELQSWLDKVGKNRSSQELASIRLACETVRRICVQAEVPDDYCVARALAVADILADLRMDTESLIGSLLAGPVRDGLVDLEQIKETFGEREARLVEGVCQMELIHDLRQHAGEAGNEVENLRKMLLAMVEDVRVVVLALADRVCTMRTLAARPEDERRGVARETMDIYGPLANRLGIGQLKWELEDLAFRFIEPELYKEIAGLIDERRKNREKFILRVINHLQNALQNEGIHAQIDGRPKHIYSIWRKMKRKDKDYHEIYDVRAVRVLVDEIRDCYAVLGVVHSLWMPIPGEFDDYIATPKENGYRSLHTAVIGPKGKTLEVQIRTNQMHQESEYGVAAHWRYKEGTRFDAGFESKIAWLRQILEWKDELANITDFVDHLKSEVLEDRVYVFTPKGNVFDFPQGASPVDFAYRIHTEIGHRCRGAKVDGVIVPLNTELKTGERVEILTAKEGGPSRDWLNSDLGYIKTSKARTKVQHWFRQLNIEQNIAGGRQLLEKELHRLGLSKLRYEDLAKQQGYQKVEDFLAALGRGELKVTQVNRTAQELVAELIEPARPPERSLPVLRRQSGPDAAPDVQVEGVGNLLTQIAKCCKPVPGEPIVGFITQGRGVTIHRRDCPNVVRFQEKCFERLMEVNWDEETKGVVQADIHINAVDRPGLLHDITAVLANDKINLIAAQTLSSKHNNSAEMDLTLEIGDMQQLSRILSKINALPNVVDAWRRLA